ncbi:hypothetical protein SDC9_85152 [bioreactor metagenome]|uniref:Uncharacterized protein n=1 Tax=bioreactor metagenome TaxID=1076179 RepID=A0A644ZIK4_9ZZZZ
MSVIELFRYGGSVEQDIGAVDFHQNEGLLFCPAGQLCRVEGREVIFLHICLQVQNPFFRKPLLKIGLLKIIGQQCAAAEVQRAKEQYARCGRQHEQQAELGR